MPQQCLHAITTLYCSSPNDIRIQLCRDFIEHIKTFEAVKLYIVELAFGDAPFHVTLPDDSCHLQLRTDADNVLWHKEAMLNAALDRIVPSDALFLAWIDADLVFEDSTWPSRALKMLSSGYDYVQLFDRLLWLSENDAFVERETSGFRKSGRRATFGFAWAFSRRLLDTIGGRFYDACILGGGDKFMLDVIRREHSTEYSNISLAYHQEFCRMGVCTTPLRMRGIAGTVKHRYHGSYKSRMYKLRMRILKNAEFDPNTMLVRQPNGLWKLNIEHNDVVKTVASDIAAYFQKRLVVDKR